LTGHSVDEGGARAESACTGLWGGGP